MSTDYLYIAKHIAQIASTEAGISVENLPNLLNDQITVDKNCVPGLPTKDCHHIAFFISLSGRLAKGEGHYAFNEILSKIEDHFARCNKTDILVLVTDSWSASIYDAMLENLIDIKDYRFPGKTTVDKYINKIAKNNETGNDDDTRQIEIYLIGYPGWVTEIPIPYPHY